MDGLACLGDVLRDAGGGPLGVPVAKGVADLFVLVSGARSPRDDDRGEVPANALTQGHHHPGHDGVVCRGNDLIVESLVQLEQLAGFLGLDRDIAKAQRRLQ